MSNNEKSKPTKRKIITYYLIFAACLLVIAAVTVGIVFAVKNNRNISNIDTPVTNPDDNDGNKEPQKPEDPDKPIDTSTKYEFIVPIAEVNLSQANVFAYDKTLDRYCVHDGMDFAAAAGTKVYAAVDGTVTEVSVNDALCGAIIKIQHANGVETVYKFVQPVENLKAGDTVNRGDVIATVATATGVENADGDHLHFEVYKDGKLVDPDDYLGIISK